ncbi:DNA-deoxyinosine glycosylase [uncultured Brevundimonas sp.]|uniref:DNA-deoxyinosine glycosylase n=1 Tax=uncultured Brevundimonas sp. TaxID=213418 RepID=UPI002614147A|nr:DNA-deoxyinosine glycosylase [uncultured Brevundimonas sp.]
MADAPARSIGFAPEVTPETRVLILGSLPGVASLAAGQYYAHPRNAFWPVMGQLVGVDLPSMPYSERVAALKAKGFGLWDVLASAERSGSLDAAIRSPEAADLVGLVSGLPQLHTVAFNGAAAAKIGRRILKDLPERTRLVDLPSSSPAHARPLAEKSAAWRAALFGSQDVGTTGG